MPDFIPDITPYKALICGLYEDVTPLPRFIDGFRKQFNGDIADAKGNRVVWPETVRDVALAIKTFVAETKNGKDAFATEKCLPTLLDTVELAAVRLSTKNTSREKHDAYLKEQIGFMEEGLAYFDEILASCGHPPLERTDSTNPDDSDYDISRYADKSKW